LWGLVGTRMGYVNIASVTVTREFDIPFQCSACRLETWARIVAQGSATTAVEHHRLEELATHAAYGNAFRAVTNCPCPRCASPSQAFEARIQLHAKQLKRRKTWRTVLAAVFGTLGLLSSGGCAAQYPDLGTAAPGVAIWTFLWLVPLAVTVLMLGPPVPPRVHSSPHVRFAVPPVHHSSPPRLVASSA
jgi:hypothetical protein